MKCGGRTISEYDENLPKDLSVEDILVYSSQYWISQNRSNYWSRKT